MIRIIDDKPAPSAVKRTACDNCGAQLEYTRSDTRIETRTDYTGSSDRYRVLNCPKCREKLTVDIA